MKKVTILFLFLFLMATAGCGGSSSSIQPSDYSDANNWMGLPAAASYGVDTFYLYPTAVAGADKPSLVPIDDSTLREGAQAVFARHKPVYETATNVFAPYYRQVNLAVADSATAKELEELLSAESLADVCAALDYYFEHYNNGRPFILAGHSQGSAMVKLVLKNYMKAHPDHYARMAAAYVLATPSRRMI